MDKWDIERAKGLEVRRLNALAHARAIDETLGTAIKNGEFDWVDQKSYSTLSLAYLTKFLQKKGHRSSTGTTLSATGVMRALSLIGADWQSYCVMIAERAIRIKNLKYEEADYIDAKDAVMTVATERRAIKNNERRNIRWIHYVSPARLFEMEDREDVDFIGWLDERYLRCGQRFSFCPEERENLLQTFERWHVEKYGAHAETYVRPEFHLPTRPRSRPKQQTEQRPAPMPHQNDGWMTEDFYNQYMNSHA